MRLVYARTAIVAGILFSGCGVDSSCSITSGCSVEAKHEDKKEDFSYQLSENGCDTGKVKYNDDADYCSALKNDRRNNFCARNMRRQAFEAHKCAGTFY